MFYATTGLDLGRPCCLNDWANTFLSPLRYFTGGEEWKVPSSPGGRAQKFDSPATTRVQGLWMAVLCVPGTVVGVPLRVCSLLHQEVRRGFVRIQESLDTSYEPQEEPLDVAGNHITRAPPAFSKQPQTHLPISTLPLRKLSLEEEREPTGVGLYSRLDLGSQCLHNRIPSSHRRSRFDIEKGYSRGRRSSTPLACADSFLEDGRPFCGRRRSVSASAIFESINLGHTVRDSVEFRQKDSGDSLQDIRKEQSGPLGP